MKWLLALVAVSAAASLAVGARVVLHNRDPVPGDTIACARKAGLSLARSSDALTLMRADVQAHTLRVLRRWDWGRSSGVLVGGSAPGRFAVLALWNADTPSLAADAALSRIYDRPNHFPAVFAELPDAGALVRCARKN